VSTTALGIPVNTSVMVEQSQHIWVNRRFNDNNHYRIKHRPTFLRYFHHTCLTFLSWRVTSVHQLGAVTCFRLLHFPRAHDTALWVLTRSLFSSTLRCTQSIWVRLLVLSRILKLVPPQLCERTCCYCNRHIFNAHMTRVVGWSAMLQAGRSWVRFPMRSLHFSFNWPNPSSRTMALR
jgi:hypothetical protein